MRSATGSLCAAAVLAAFLLLPTARGGDSRDPETRAIEAKITAHELRKEIRRFTEMAEAAGRPVEGDLKKYLEHTEKEAEWLEKASRAWDNNQRNLAAKHMERAAEFCQKRGPFIARFRAEMKAREIETAKERAPSSGAKEAGSAIQPGQKKHREDGHEIAEKPGAEEEPKPSLHPVLDRQPRQGN